MLDVIHPTEARSIRLLLVDGSANGILRADAGRNLTAYRSPRSRLKALCQRKEASQAGIYILCGDDPDSVGRYKLYIGETDSMQKRLPIHDKNYDFFDRLVIAVGKDDNLTKAHFRYVESELIRLAKYAPTAAVINSTDPGFDRLSEADRIEAKYFLGEIVLLLPVLGFDFFRGRGQADEATDVSDSPLFEARISGAQATGRETNDGFLVLAGSMARVQETDSFPAGLKALRDQLVREHRLVIDQMGIYRFAEDVGFTSASAAASVVGARSASGPLEWKRQGTGETYKEWRAAKLAY